jgi:hypothetical protein
VPERRYRPSEITGLRFEGIIADLSDNGAINVLVLHRRTFCPLQSTGDRGCNR